MAGNTVSPDGDRLKSVRQDRGWSQDDLAAKAGTTKRTVQRVEGGQPTYATTLALFAEALGVEPKCLRVNETQSSDQTALGYPFGFATFIEDRTRDFVGRDFVFDAIGDFQTQRGSRCGYFIIEGDPGVGKSAIIAEYVKRTGCVAHFNIQPRGITRADQFVESISRQLNARMHIEGDDLSKAQLDPRQLSELLESAAARLKDDEKLVIAIDALDEVDLTGQTAHSNVLYLPDALPTGVYFVMTARRAQDLPFVAQSPLGTLDLRRYQTETTRDVRTYISRCAKQEQLRRRIKKYRLTVNDFVAQLADKSESNFMYLHYVLPAIAHGDYAGLDLDKLPVGLQAYYDDHWRRMGMMSKPLPTEKIKVVYVMCEASEPISVALIADFVHIDPIAVQTIINEWAQFLHVYSGDEVPRYGIYHASFRDFLHRKEIVQAANVTVEGINAAIADQIWEELVEDE